MRRLTTYLARLFATDALVLFGIVCFLLWLVNCLRSFEVVSVKGQGFATLAVQALYTMPQLGLAFFYICVGIGLVRALTALQSSHELHIIHTSKGISGLWRAAAMVTSVAVVAVMLFAHWVEPNANRKFSELSASVAADLVSSTLRPGRFTQVTPGVILLIGGRGPDGEIREFFADDRREGATRRTFIAESARISSDGENYVLELRNGSLQYVQEDGRYSEVRFIRYDLSVDSLSQPLIMGDSLAERDSFDLIAEAMATRQLEQPVLQRLLDRSAEALRVIGICLFVLAIAAFPSGRRARIPVPLEAVVMLVAFGERGIGTYSPLGVGTGSVLLILISGAVMAYRLWPRRPRSIPA
ncbi:MAG: LptF/LptG family permease [Devosia sp.]|uniref:LptF/LptG family permease n=1 Tax=unclassified Devosia TaxID=196773 RepID=UPI0019F77BF2|nr:MULTISPECIES: LptF/LptG family permease [unclassified Devosia]MBF0679636.1 LptF/LptG family permease [Devosia sp.]WEJ32213.1 LptF/LptG family permease [Devosia sp. SD17-2]